MRFKLSDLWTTQGTIGRAQYALAGLVLFILKHGLDRAVAYYVFHREWWITSYFVPGSSLLTLGATDRKFFGALLIIAIPFIWCGVMLTLKRLRSAGMREGLVVFFFVPAVNLIFFSILCLVPEPSADAAPKESIQHWLTRAIPHGEVASAVAGVLVVVPPALALTYLSTDVLSRYGWGLFVGVPFTVGLVSSVIYCHNRPRSFWRCLAVASVAIWAVGAILLCVAFEGALCLIMAAPLGWGLALIGACVGYLISGMPNQSVSILLACCLSAPAIMGFDWIRTDGPPLFTVVSHVDIAAPPERVWDSVVAFTHIPDPQEWIFKAGVAYPIQATIHGKGPGAVRQCMFSTGSFVEPIEVWDAPHLLKFSVRCNPAPLQEWTPYGNICPAHLEGYLQSEGGQFRLLPLPDGSTRLEGTTWYHHGLWPANYWKVWSDSIIHQIHMRVLGHIKRTVELRGSQERPAPTGSRA